MTGRVLCLYTCVVRISVDLRSELSATGLSVTIMGKKSITFLHTAVKVLFTVIAFVCGFEGSFINVLHNNLTISARTLEIGKLMLLLF